MAKVKEDKFDPFVVSTHTYKTIDGHPILLDMFIPKNLIQAGGGSEEWKVKRPVMLYFHAGWLIAGQREFQPCWSRWILDLMVKNGAIGITADHRLIPEATCEDVLDDIHDLWDWIHRNLSQVVQKYHPGLQPDLRRVLLAGSSSGGYCALQLGLSYSRPAKKRATCHDHNPRAVLALYPYISLRTPYWTEAYSKKIFGMPQLPPSTLDYHLASISMTRDRAGKTPVLSNVAMLDSEGKATERALLAICAQQHGRILELFGAERDISPGKRRVHPEDRIVDGHKLPPTVIVQGEDDTICPANGCDLFVENLRKYVAVAGLDQGKEEGEVLRYLKVPGEHLFETELRLNKGTEDWVKEAASFIEKHWL